LRFSKLYAPTIKESPSDSDLISYELLVRGGFIRKVAAGIYTYLPLGMRVLSKITSIVRDEMEKAGCQELLMPIMQPSVIWKESGRWEDYGPEMMKLLDRHDREFTLGPTHEEMITETVKNELVSYKDLPVNLFQINTKYRDEIRPRFGLLRGREFIMKDSYSFHTDEESLDDTYKVMYKSYENILDRMGLEYMAVEADTGAIGGSNSHEFVVLADNGESDLRFCTSCRYSATDEKAECKTDYEYPFESEKEIEMVHTPNVKSIKEVSGFLGVAEEKIVKSLLLNGRDGFVMVLIRGDFEINLSKIRAGLKDQTLQLAEPDTVFKNFEVPTGFVGPVNLNKENVMIIADMSIKNMKNFIVGALKADHHFTNVNMDRDFKINSFMDIKLVEEGDACPVCGNSLSKKRGIEMGQVFKLGTKYSEKLQTYYTNENGKQMPFVMGCYGWGISRSVAGIVEQCHDDNGIIWPASVAPYLVEIVLINGKDEKQVKVADELYDYLQKNDIEVILDDRVVSPGFKFKDADLIGFPIRLTVGKTVKEDMIEMKVRKNGEMRKISIVDNYEECLKVITEVMKEL